MSVCACVCRCCARAAPARVRTARGGTGKLLHPRPPHPLPRATGAVRARAWRGTRWTLGGTSPLLARRGWAALTMAAGFGEGGGGGKDRCTATWYGRWAELFGGGVRADTTRRDDSRGRRCRGWSSDHKPSGNPSPGGRGQAARQDTRHAPSGSPSRMRASRPTDPEDAMQC